MSDRIPKSRTTEADMLPKYDLSKMKIVGRGKYYRAYRKGHSVSILNEDGTIEVKHYKGKDQVVTLDPDVSRYFPDSESVNKALRSLIALIPQKPRRTKTKV
jgi:hypothetical protein